MGFSIQTGPLGVFRNYGFELFVLELVSLLLPLLEPLAPAPAPELVLPELPELELPELEPPGLVALPSLGELEGALLIALELRSLLVPLVSLAPPSFLLHPTNASATPTIRSIFFIQFLCCLFSTIELSCYTKDLFQSHNAVKPCLEAGGTPHVWTTRGIDGLMDGGVPALSR